MIKRRPLTATTLRAILSVAMFVIAAVGGVAFWIANSKLEEYAIQVSHTSADADASRSNLQNLQKIQQTLTQDQEVVQRASNIVADSQSYQYQNQIITDLNDYAAKAGIEITNINFASTQTTTGGATPTPAAPAAPAPSGVKSMPVSVTLKNPVDYLSLLKFVKSIEENLTKMQISRINLSKDPTKNSVTSDALTIEVYVR